MLEIYVSGEPKSGTVPFEVTFTVGFVAVGVYLSDCLRNSIWILALFVAFETLLLFVKLDWSYPVI